MISKRKFAKLFGSMSALMIAVTIIMVMAGSTVALPIAGIGGFTQKVDSLESPEFYMYPTLSSTDDPDERIDVPNVQGIGQYPTAAAELGDGTEIENLRLFKVFEVSDYNDLRDIASLAPNIDSNASARLLIRADNLTTNGPLLVEQSSLEAEEATFNGLEVITQEGNTTSGNDHLLDQPTQFLQQANQQDPQIGAGNPYQDSTRFVGDISAGDPAIDLENATIRGHYLAANSLTFEGMELVVQFDMNGDGSYEFSGGVAPP